MTIVLYVCLSRGSVNSPYESALLNALSMFPRLLLDFATELELSSTHSPERQTDCVVKLLQTTVPSQASTHCHVQSAAPLLELTTTPPELLDLTCVPLLLAITPELEPGTTPELLLVTSPLDELVCSPPLLEVTATLPEESSA